MYYDPKISQKIFQVSTAKRHKPQNFGLQKFLCAIGCIYFKKFWHNPFSMIASQKKYFVANLIPTAYILILNLLDRTFYKAFEPLNHIDGFQPHCSKQDKKISSIYDQKAQPPKFWVAEISVCHLVYILQKILRQPTFHDCFPEKIFCR